MPDHKASRSWHEALRRVGVVNPEEVRIASPVQMQAVVDELSHLVPPVVVPVVSFGGFGHAAAAGNHSAVHLAVRSGGGAWVEDVGDYSGTWQLKTTRTALAVINSTTVDVSQLTWPAAEPVASVLTLEEILAATIFAGTNRRGDTASRLQMFPFYLRPGDHLYIWDNTIATTFDGAITWREVPRSDFSQA